MRAAAFATLIARTSFSPCVRAPSPSFHSPILSHPLGAPLPFLLPRCRRIIANLSLSARDRALVLDGPRRRTDDASRGATSTSTPSLPRRLLRYLRPQRAWWNQRWHHASTEIPTPLGVVFARTGRWCRGSAVIRGYRSRYGARGPD
jgi:hypothetical protein